VKYGKEYRSFFYNMIQYYEEEKDADVEIQDMEQLVNKAKEHERIFLEMGLDPIKPSSPIGIWSDNVLKRLKFPTSINIPLHGEDKLDFLRMVEECRLGREWIQNYWIGHFKKGETFDYDVRSSYGYNLSQCLDYQYATFQKSTTAVKDADDGLLQGTITIYPNVRYSPICFNNNKRTLHPVNKTWDDVITLKEVRWIYRHKIGEFKLDYGYFWKYNQQIKPFEIVLNRVYALRDNGGMVRKMAKRIGSAAWGKLLQATLPSGDVNPYYSPVLGMQAQTSARLQVGDFIYDNKLNETDDVLCVSTDGVRTLKEVVIPENKRMGEWRMEEPTECLVLSAGLIFTPNKRPQGITYEELMTAIHNKPSENIWQNKIMRHITLTEAIDNMGDINKVGEIGTFYKGIGLPDLRGEQTCLYDKYPETGKELLENKYMGNPKVE
jgi:hypothetical protein